MASTPAHMPASSTHAHMPTCPHAQMCALAQCKCMPLVREDECTAHILAQAEYNTLELSLTQYAGGYIQTQVHNITAPQPTDN